MVAPVSTATLWAYAPTDDELVYRGLKFTAIGLRRSQQNPSEELSVSFQKAYEGSLRPYHGMLIRPLFSVSLAYGPGAFVTSLTACSTARDECMPLPGYILPKAG